jgi:hypothetical protein
MLRIIRSATIALVLAGVSGITSAKESSEGGTGVVVGLKTWMNDREVKHDGESADFDSMLLVGPLVEVEFANGLFLEASYMDSATNYEIVDHGTTLEFERSDLDSAIGYMFNHNVGVFAGYRHSVIEEIGGHHEKLTASGPLVGVRGSVPVADKISLFGKFTYLLNENEEGDSTHAAETEDAPGYIAELGGKYHFTTAFAAALGYKMETTEGDTTLIEDTFSGFTLDLTYVFH